MSCCRNFLSHYFDLGNLRWPKLEKQCRMTRLWYFTRMGTPSTIYLKAPLTAYDDSYTTQWRQKFWNKGAHQLRGIIWYNHEGEQMHAALFFPYPWFFPLGFPGKVFNEAASRAHHEINVFVPSLGFSPKGFFQDGYNKTLFHLTDIQGGVL